jgi:hypothetical protein
MGYRAGVVFLAIVTILLPGGPARAALDEWALGFKAGTLGIGPELTTNLAPDLHLRGSVLWFELDVDDVEFDNIEYDASLDLLNSMLLLDWYPFAGEFRISGGVLFNGTDVSLDATPAGPVQIGNAVYLPADIGSIRGDADFDDVAPYVGIGFGRPLSSDRRWGLTADIGVAYIGSPNVDLSVTGPLADNPILLAGLAEKEEEIEDDLDNFKFYPVLALTLYYRF